MYFLDQPNTRGPGLCIVVKLCLRKSRYDRTMRQLELTKLLGPRQRTRFHRLTLGALSTQRPRGLESQVRALDSSERSAWLAFADRNDVAPQIAHCLGEVFPDESPRSDWNRIHRRSADRMHVLMEELDRVADRLSNQSILLVALKNAGIARGIYPCPACCPMGDLDVLVDRSRFEEAHKIIVDCDFELASRGTVEPPDHRLGLANGGSEYVRRVGGEEVWLELQWRPVAGRWIRKDQEPDGSQLLARSIPITGTHVRLLAPADNMLQVSLHTAKHSYVRAPGLRLHTDVDRLASLAPPDWTEVIETTERLGVRTPVYFSLALAAALLGSPIPDRVLDALAPARWKAEAMIRWLRKVNLFEPNEKKFNRPGMLVFHALLYDDASGLAASVLDTDPKHIGLKYLPENARKGFARMVDVMTRYQS
jgi:hypothetical protein